MAVCNKENSYYDPADEYYPLLIDENVLKERRLKLNDYKCRLLKLNIDIPGVRKDLKVIEETMIDENSLTPVKAIFRN